jgi:hypothetical protein
MESESTEQRSRLEQSALLAAKALDLLGREEPPMACCPRCSEPTPLISTMAFRHYEFYCLECGGRFGFLSPRAETDTPDLQAHYERLQAEWDEHAGERLIVEGYEGGAKPDKLAAHEEALAWLAERAGKTVSANG